MAYRILSLIQSFFIFLCGISVLDFGLDLSYVGIGGENKSFGFNNLLFENSETVWWSTVVFWAYLFFIVAIIQLIKGIVVKEK